MVSKEEVKYIAKLARFNLNENEIEKLQKDFSSILDFFVSLKNVDVSKIKLEFYSASKGLTESQDFMRDDKDRIESPDLAQKLIAMSPEKKDNYIKVKAVF